MHLLLTNDDGIDAPGLEALRKACEGIGYRVSIVAPASEQSMCGHRVTTYRPISVEKRSPDRWAVHGTPADCVRIALFALGIQPDAVLSGINAGGNLGQDIYISGTCAGAREAAYHSIRAVAFSHYLIRDLPVDWARISTWVAPLLDHLLSSPLPQATWVNVNFPHLSPEVTQAPQALPTAPEMAPLGVSFDPIAPSSFIYTAKYADRPFSKGSDVHTVFNGSISVSHIKL
jgi:5'-nucleotidase